MKIDCFITNCAYNKSDKCTSKYILIGSDNRCKMRTIIKDKED